MVTTGAENVEKESASEILKVSSVSYKEKTLELYNKLRTDPNMRSVERNEKNGAVKATDIRRKSSKGNEAVLTYPVGEDTKGCTKLSCGTKDENLVNYSGKQLEERCQDVLFHKGCVCILRPDKERDESGNTKSSVDCLFMKEGMDEPVKADIKSLSPRPEEMNDKIGLKHVSNTIGRANKQANKDLTDYVILYYDNPDYYDGEAVKNGITMYAKNDNIENKQVKNFIIVVNDERPVDIISIDQLSV